MKSGIHLTRSEIDNIINDYKAGDTAKTISSRYNIADVTVYQLLRKNNVPVHNPQMSQNTSGRSSLGEQLKESITDHEERLSRLEELLFTDIVSTFELLVKLELNKKLKALME